MVESRLPAGQTSRSVSPTQGVFVGRQREMDELEAALTDAQSGQGRLVMLVGEPGIGKTRTARELSFHAELQGAQVLWGWCYEEAGAPPYWPWVQPLRSYIQRLGPDQLRGQLGVGAADIAEIIPEVREKLPDLESPPALEPEQARFRLFDSITTFLKNASLDQPIMLVLDDLHWADKPSLLLLQFLARQISESHLLVVGCYRDMELSRQHPLAETLAQLVREPVFQRKPLPGLSREDTGDFIRAMAGVAAAPGLLDAVHTRAEGNPFFTSELVRLLGDQGVLSEASTGETLNVAIPQGVREAIGHRLNRLSQQCNQVLTVAAVVGREFSLEQLSRLNEDLSDERLLEVLEEALAARIIEETSRPASSYSFCHALIQETLLSELSAARRARLHARIARALEELYCADVESHASELAYHFGEGVQLIGPEKLVKYSSIAGEQALAAYAWEEALKHFQRGLETKKSQPVDSDTAALLFGLGRAQLAVLDPQEYQNALTNLTRAFDYYAEVGDIDHAVAVAQCPVQSSPLTGHRTGVDVLITRALALVPTGSREAGYLLCQYGNTLYYETSNHDGALEALRQALTIAEREGDSVLKMRTLVAAGHAEAAHLHFQECLKYDLAAIELANSVDEPFEETHALQEVTAVLHRSGDLEGARRHAASALEVAEKLRHRTRLWQNLQANTVVCTLEGDWDTARSLSDRALAISPRNPNLLGYRSLIEYLLGDQDQGGAYLDRLLGSMRRATPGPTLEYAYPAIVTPLVAHLTGADHQLEEARTAANAVLSSPWVSPVLASLAWAGLALLAVRQGDAESANERYSALLPRRGAMVGGLHDSIISCDRLLGLLAGVIGSPDQAAAHFEDALAFCRNAGYRPELAWTCYDYANTLLQHIDPGDRSRPASLLDESLTIASELSMRPLTEKVLVLQEQLETLPAKRPVYPDGLTEREVEVLRLVAAGKTSAEIATELVLSRRTVERHISNIFTKTNSHNRSEATAFAFTHGLVLPG